LRLKKLRILAALPLLALPIESAYCFDKSRLYTTEAHSSDALPYAYEQSSSISQDDFVLAPSGMIAKAEGIANMNTVSSSAIPEATSDLTKQRSSEEVSTSKLLNTTYSHIIEPVTLGTECGPSPMKPSEIEKLVGATAEAYGVDPGLAKAIAWTESRFDQIRNSPKGARGPMQLMPETALGLGVRDACDPASNIDGGVRYLRALIEEFKNPLVAAAAYNAGSQAVYDNGGIPPYGETIRYVATVINRQFGLQIRPSGRGAHPDAISANKLSQSGQQSNDVVGARGSRFVNGVMHF
jgi:hypothetical protein